MAVEYYWVQIDWTFSTFLRKTPRNNISWEYAIWFLRFYICTDRRTEGFPRKYKTNLGLLEDETFISLVIWHSVRFQKNISLHSVMKEHPVAENTHDNVLLEKYGIYGKRKRFVANPQRLKNREKRSNKWNREE